MKTKILVLFLSLVVISQVHSSVVFKQGNSVGFSLNKAESQVVFTALEILKSDFQRVFDAELLPDDEGLIQVATLGVDPFFESIVSNEVREWLKNHKEGFVIQEVEGKLIVIGSDKRGTAYGLLEISRLIGVSPWEWWADSPVKTMEKFQFKSGFTVKHSPSVAHRGIFINDEDWGLMPWSNKNHDPSEVKGRIGAKTHARVFELLLRLRANTLWPAMHDCSEAFFFGPGNKETADKYGILIGTSHCEPMLRNTNAEWRVAGKGKYDFVNNPESVIDFWKERVEEQKNSDNIFTLGIRGVHDGKMEGAKTLEEQKAALVDVLATQRKMIATMVNPLLDQVPQVFIPYKEVLDVYKLGLEVPEDVTLMWTDDNYGYIKHFPTKLEAARKGGNGVYYHVSYWGRPHDYLWLATTHPAQLYYQMKLAYDKGSRDIWILNIGDIKPAEYLTELFMDLAWDINSIKGNAEGLNMYLFHWLSREFGTKVAKELVPVMKEYYRLAYIRKPEFMANTRTEEKDPGFKVAKDLPWSKEYMLQRLSSYKVITDKVIELSGKIQDERKSAWFQLIEYPVSASYEMNRKHIMASMARHGFADWTESDAAYDRIVALTAKYNSLENGKWRYIMDYSPRNLAVFQPLDKVKPDKPLPKHLSPRFKWNGVDYKSFIGDKPLAIGLGYENGAVAVDKNSELEFVFKSQVVDSVILQFKLAPNHPVDGDQIRFGLTVNGSDLEAIDYATYGRSEEWKQNMLSNQAVREQRIKLVKGKNSIRFTALDEGVILDQVLIWPMKEE